MSKPEHKKAKIKLIEFNCPQSNEEISVTKNFYFGMDTLHSLGKESEPYIVINKCPDCEHMHVVDVERVNA